MGALQNKERALFQSWKQGKASFCFDGIVHEDKYLDSKQKVLFVLKEANGKPDEEIDLKDFLKHGAYGRKASWLNISRWMHGINTKECNWSQIEQLPADDLLNKYLPTIGVVNLKKTVGIHTTDTARFSSEAIKDASLINQQFDLYFNDQSFKPEIVIGCGSLTTEVLFKVWNKTSGAEWKRTLKGVYYTFIDDVLYIDFLHPEARVPDHFKYFGLIDALIELDRL